MKPKTNRQRKERDIDKDTVVAYHEFIQGRIHGELNGVWIGPGRVFAQIALGSAIFGFVCLIVGVLVITLRHRHVYLVDWNEQFLGPAFLIVFLLCSSFSVFLLMIALRRTNDYRKDLAFRPIGDYGVAVVHKSKLTYDDAKKSELKSGTTPHNVRHPGRPGVNDRGNRGDPSKSRAYDNRGYRDDYDGGRRPDRPDRDRSDNRDRRRPDDRRPPPGDRRPRPPPGPDDRRRRPDDREPRGRGGDPNRERRPRPPPGSEEEKRRIEARRRYEEDKRRKYEEDRRRAELRKQAEAGTYDRMLSSGDERGVDVGGTKTYEITTHVTLSRGMQPTDESDL